MLSFSTLSVQYVPAQVTATIAGLNYNPTSDVVQMAFTSGTGQPSTWFTGTWETDQGAYVALCLIGPGTTAGQLAAGVWNVWVKVTDNPEVPVIRAGQIQVY